MSRISQAVSTTITTVRCGAGLKAFAFGTTLLLAGCYDSKIIKTEEVKSPDGTRTARSQIRETGGLGNAGLYTEVFYLGKDASKPLQILILNDKSLNTADVQMQWQDNNTLDISHFPDSEVEFQVAKTGGVQINVH